MIRALWPTELIARRAKSYRSCPPETSDGVNSDGVNSVATTVPKAGLALPGRRRGIAAGEKCDGFFDQALIGGRKLKVAQARRIDPLAGLALKMLDFALFMNANERVQPDADLGIVVFDDPEAGDRASAEVQLLGQFAGKTFFEGFVTLAFSTGEFPVSAKGRVCFALTDQNLTLAGDNSDRDIDAVHGIELT